MRKLLPSPLLSLALLVTWLMLNESASVGQLLLGATLALALPWFTERWRPLRPRLRLARLGTLLGLAAAAVFWDAAVAVYLVLATAGILHFAVRLESGGDPLLLGQALSRALPVGFGVYVAALALAQLAL